MHTSFFLTSFLAICSFTSALPAPQRHELDRQRTPVGTFSDLQVPLTSGKLHQLSHIAPTNTFVAPGLALSAPISGLTLKAVAFGRGTQNYTCATNTAASIPHLVGAKASLFDASALLPYIPRFAVSWVLNIFPTVLLDFSLEAVSRSFPQLGVHFFNSAGTPTFDLTQSNTGLLACSKIGDIAAPAGATRGAYGAVDWLQLSATVGGPSQKLGEVYRVYTAGGKAPATCDGMAAAFEIQYAAQYWFFG
jgi:hypothetical protein